MHPLDACLNINMQENVRQKPALDIFASLNMRMSDESINTDHEHNGGELVEDDDDDRCHLCGNMFQSVLSG